MKYTCWTEISSIGIIGTVLPGMGESTYKVHINLGKKVKRNGKKKKYIYIYIYIKEKSITRYKLYAKPIRSITYKVIKSIVYIYIYIYIYVMEGVDTILFGCM